MDAVGIRIEFTKQKFPDTLKQGLAGQLQMWGLANTNTNDNGSSFLDLLYGPHKGMSNLGALRPARVQCALRSGEEVAQRAGARAALPGDVEARRGVRAVGAAHLPDREHHRAPVGVGYKYDTFDPHPWMYLDLDLAQRRGAAK